MLFSQCHGLVVFGESRKNTVTIICSPNAFGVNSTHIVYEYWTFYRLLYQLEILGFQIENQSSLVEHFRNFISGKQPRQKYSGYIARASRSIDNGTGKETINIEIGYERVFYTDKTQDGKRFQRTPDYYIRILNSQGHDHWYFMDAKYKCFSDGSSGKVNYHQEIYDVAISKYIRVML